MNARGPGNLTVPGPPCHSMLLTSRGFTTRALATLLAALVLPTVLAFTLTHAGLALLTLLRRLVVVQLHGLPDLFFVLPPAALLLLAGLRLLLLLLLITLEVLLLTHSRTPFRDSALDRSSSEIARPAMKMSKGHTSASTL